MPFTFNMPKLSPTMEMGTIAKWHKKAGDKVEPGDVVLEISTDKATVEHEAIDEGFLAKILVNEGEEAEVNQPIAILTEKKGESIEGFEAEPKKAPKEEEEPEEKQQEPTEEKKEKKPAAEMRQPGFAPLPPLEGYEFEMPTEALNKRVLASPLARRLAKERNLDLTTVKGSGPGGRIMERDLERAQPSGVVTFGHRERPSKAPGSFVEEPLTQMRKVISQRLQEAKTFIPHFYVTQVIDASQLVIQREQLKNLGLNVSFNDMVIRASALALKEHPGVNSAFHSANQSVARYQTIDISVAVTLPEGLITPIIRNADYKNMGEISVEVKSLVKKAKAGKLKPEEFQGGSFTVSNMGMFGITEFSAIINPPQAAILAVGGIQEVPVVKEGAVVPGKTMHLTLSADHRVVDGVMAAEFMKTLQKYLENPSALLL